MTPNEPKPDDQIKLYKGPSKPIPTHREIKEIISDRAELLIFAVIAAVFVVLLLTGVI